MKKNKTLAALFISASLMLPAASIVSPVFAEETPDAQIEDITDMHAQMIKNLETINPDTSASDAKSEEAASAIIEAAKQLPDKIDLRNYQGKNYVTPVKYQWPYSSCWAFSIAGAAEISYLFANDAGVPAGQENKGVDFSEKHINWYMYNRIKPADVNGIDIPAAQAGEGFNTYLAQKANVNAVFDFGGNMGYGSNLLASGMGPVDESYEVDGTAPFVYSGKNGWRDNDRNESAQAANARRDYYYNHYKDHVSSLVYDGEIDYSYQYNDYFKDNWKSGNKYYEKSFESSGYSAFDDWSLPDGYQYRIPGVKAFFKNSNVLPAPALCDEKGKYTFNEEGVAAIKLEISKGNGVSIAYFADESKPGQKTGDDGFMNTTNWAQYYTGVALANHAVTVVGYDDNYPKENFTRTSNGKVSEKSTPPADGAFIVKNSWGALTEEDKKNVKYDADGNPVYDNPNARSWGIDDTGYFYLSYYDNSIVMAESFEFFNDNEVEYDEIDYAQHDLFQGIAYGENESDTKISTANVFEVKRDGELYQISYMAPTPGTTVHYDIYKDVKGDDPTSGTLLESGEESYLLGGYHRITLKNKYPLKKCDKYSVVITQTHKGEDGSDKYSEVYAKIQNTYASKDVIIKTVVNKGESYVFKDGKWTDFSQAGQDIVKAMYDEELESSGREDFDSSYPNGIKDFGVDNYPIKAFLIPAGSDGGSDETTEATESTDETRTESETEETKVTDETNSTKASDDTNTNESDGESADTTANKRQVNNAAVSNVKQSGKAAAASTGDRSNTLPLLITIISAGVAIIASAVVIKKKTGGKTS